MVDGALLRTLDTALRKSVAVWVRPGARPARLVWGVWRAHALWLATGGGSGQDVPGLADGAVAVVTVRSPTTRSHLAEVPMAVTRAEPDAPTAAALVAARLNGPSSWARGDWDAVWRLEPVSAQPHGA
jgi:hypothetical protein